MRRPAPKQRPPASKTPISPNHAADGSGTT